MLQRSGWVALLSAMLGLLTLAACEASAAATPRIVGGSSTAPREVNIVLKDWLFLPDPLDVVPGETVILHVVNGGLEVHELVIGDLLVQSAWEAAEAIAADPPPGPTPVVSVDPASAGLRVVVPSGQRVDVTWTAPADRAVIAATILGCHIPGHWDKGMRATLRVATTGG